MRTEFGRKTGNAELSVLELFVAYAWNTQSFTSLYSMTCDMFIIKFCEIILSIARHTSGQSTVFQNGYFFVLLTHHHMCVRNSLDARRKTTSLWLTFFFSVAWNSDLLLIVRRIDINLLRATAARPNWFHSRYLGHFQNDFSHSLSI